MFQMSGIQFIWVRIFVEVWDLPKGFVTLMFLLVTGVGGGIGVAFGPAYIDRKGGFGTPPGVVSSLRALRSISMIAVAAGLIGAGCLYGKGKSDSENGAWGEFGGDHWLWLVWACIFAIWATYNATIAALCGINLEVVPGVYRTMGSGVEMTLRNILGYAFGPLLPGLAMDQIKGTSQTQLLWGLSLIFLVNVLGIFIMGRAGNAAVADLKRQQDDAVHQLQTALAQDEISVLQDAVKAGKRVEVQATANGAAIMGAVNEVIGSLRKGGKRKAKTESKADLEAKVEKLTTENTSLKTELKDMQKTLLYIGFRAWQEGKPIRDRKCTI